MTKLRILMRAILVLSVPLCALAQESLVPEGYALVTPEDFAKHQQDVLRCIDYLEHTPPARQQHAQEVSAFVMKWIEGTLTVRIDLHPYVENLCQENKQFLLIYLGGWTRKELDHPGLADRRQYHLAGVRSIIAVYQRGGGIAKDERVEELVEAEKRGKLSAWLSEKLSPK